VADHLKDKIDIDLTQEPDEGNNDPNDPEHMNEDSTDDAKGTLQAIIGSLKKGDTKNKDTASMLKMANGIMDYYKKEKSFAPDQAKWIFNTSKALFK
jgi:hypothetical protein